MSDLIYICSVAVEILLFHISVCENIQLENFNLLLLDHNSACIFLHMLKNFHFLRKKTFKNFGKLWYFFQFIVRFEHL